MPHGLEVQELGAGTPVLFLHGCPTPPSLLLPLAQGVADRCRALVPALPGYGGTPALPRPYALARLYEALEGELMRRGIEELAVVGFSSGGYHALSLAVRGRVRVHTVVSLAGFCSLSQQDRDGARQLVAALRAGVDLDEASVRRFLSPSFAASHPQAVDEVKRWRHATAPDQLAAELDALVDSDDLRPRLPAISARVLCRVGDADLACPVAASEEIVRSVRGGRLEVVPGAGHSLVHEDLAGTVASLRRAL
jgi:3-oxoadipate enol-lactonase